jgi:predicted dithiol-disulfide oxidoreductase (DUF899 family)
MSIAFPGESAAYRAARDRLLESERALRAQTEAVAAQRRDLPPGGELASDYVFTEAQADSTIAEVPLAGLFGAHHALAIYHMMFPRSPDDDRPGPRDGACPSCTSLLDQLDGMVPHASENMSLAIVAKASAERLRAFADERGWRHLRLLSAGATTFNRDYHAETEQGHQMPMLNVFHRDGATIRHFWGSEMLYAPTEPGQDPRHVGPLESLWNLFDLTPAGRPDWDEQLDYCCH